MYLLVVLKVIYHKKKKQIKTEKERCSNNFCFNSIFDTIGVIPATFPGKIEKDTLIITL